jgi:carboxymethylenebutenolidase
MMLRSLPLLALLVISCATNPATTAPADRLETTTRHHEWITLENGGRSFRAYVTFPEVSGKAPAIVVIHENRGLNEWARSVADQLSEHGYIAIAPDMLGDTGTYPSEDAAREAIGKLQLANVVSDLNAAANYVQTLPAANGKVSVIGFCWGGARTWDLANSRPDLAAAYVFYGTGPQEASGVAGIRAPVYGFYGGNDARVNATIPKSEELMKAAGKKFEPVIYEGAGHAYMREGESPTASEANRKAREESWARLRDLLR